MGVPRGDSTRPLEIARRTRPQPGHGPRVNSQGIRRSHCPRPPKTALRAIQYPLPDGRKRLWHTPGRRNAPLGITEANDLNKRNGSPGPKTHDLLECKAGSESLAAINFP